MQGKHTTRVLQKLLNKESLIEDLIRENRNHEIALSYIYNGGRDFTLSDDAIEEQLDAELAVKFAKEYQMAVDKDMEESTK